MELIRGEQRRKKMQRASKKELLKVFEDKKQALFNPKFIKFFFVGNFYKTKSTIIEADYLSEAQLQYLRNIGYLCCITHEGGTKWVHIFNG